MRNSRTIHQQAFSHYLRTGHRLTNDEWRAELERKFNPYHDERGRFTSPPGVTVSWGKQAPSISDDRTPRRGKVSDRRQGTVRTVDARSSRSAQSLEPVEAAGELRSDFVRNATEDGGHAETYFELNKRQAGLDRLRKAAGPKPSLAAEADFQEIQKRLDADRVRLDARQIEVNHQTNELLRAGLAPADVAIGAFRISTGHAEVRDYLSVAGALPLGAIIRRTDGIIQLGGAHSVVKKMIQDHGLKGIVSHHVPARKSFSLAGVVIEPGKMPVIAMTVEDHMKTMSWGRFAKGIEFRAHQAKLLERGDFDGALKMDIDDLEQIPGRSFGDGIEQVLRFTHDHIKIQKR